MNYRNFVKNNVQKLFVGIWMVRETVSSKDNEELKNLVGEYHSHL